MGRYACGVAIGWKMNKIKVNTIKKHYQFIYVRVNMEDEVDWMLTAVYAIPGENGGRSFGVS